MSYTSTAVEERPRFSASESRAVRLTRRMKAGETLVGGWLTIPDLSVCDLMAGAGFDYLIIDAEHSPWTVGEIQMALAAFSSSDTVLLVRIPDHSPTYIKHVLDIGIDGLVCPLVRTAEEARALVAATRYPPRGTRGFGPRRAAAYGRSTDHYVEQQVDEIIVIPQIEDAACLDEVEGILDTDGIDAICLGPTDLSGSLGVLRQFDHPDVVSALDEVMSHARARGVPVCTGIVIPAADQPAWVEKGARLALVASDTSLLLEGAARAIREFRAAGG